MKKVLLSFLFCFALLSFGSAAFASTPATHLSIGYLIGSIDELSPAEAFILGFSSHAILDYVDQNATVNLHNSESIKTNTDLIVIDGILSVAVIRKIVTEEDPIKRKRLIWAAVGSMLPDIIDAGRYFNSNYQPIFPWHRGSFGPVRTKTDTIMTSTALVLIVYKCQF